MLNAIKSAISRIENLARSKSIKVISHYDSDGITSAAIFTKTLERWKKTFSLKITKSLDEQLIKSLPEDEILIFLDLASNSLNYLKDKKTEIFILDHHEIIQEVPENVTLINPHLFDKEQISSAAICYLFAKTLSPSNKDLSSLAVIGMIGDSLEKNIGKTFNEIIKDSETLIKRGLIIYPSTRPLDKALEYSSSPYIPGVTGSYRGVIELLKDANLSNKNGKYPALYELTEEEMSNLVTAIMLKQINHSPNPDLIGNLYLIKFFNKLEDARELSALINACSRMKKSFLSLGFCLGNKKSKEEAEKTYIEYKQHLVSALKFVSETEKISGKYYTIINAKDNIKDTIIGTVASIISNSTAYTEGTIIIALAYDEDKIKVSARIAGKQGRNVREILNQAVITLGGEVGGHHRAAGCLIPREQEQAFITEIKKILDIELVK